MARPRIDIGNYGTITTRRTGERTIAEARGGTPTVSRQVRVCRETAPQARRELKKPLLRRPGFGHAGDLRVLLTNEVAIAAARRRERKRP